MKFNYSQICSELLKGLPEKQREVVLRRFALQAKAGAKKETLESIGKSFGVTRERIRQIERDGFLGLEPETKKYSKVFQSFQTYLKKAGGLKREDILLDDLGDKKEGNQVYFLLTLRDGFERFGGAEDFHSLWALNQDYLSKAQKVLISICDKLKKIGRPVKIKEITVDNPLVPSALLSYLEVSKKIQQNSEGFYGLREWPEINPRGIKDKAYLVFQKEKKPLHFTQVASLLGPALPQTVHNELIKDPRFVLVGRGLYALEEWGYFPGYVKDVICKVLKEAKNPLTKQEVVEKVLKQRLVKENTVLLNLGDRKYFLRNPEGKYQIKPQLI